MREVIKNPEFHDPLTADEQLYMEALTTYKIEICKHCKLSKNGSMEMASKNLLHCSILGVINKHGWCSQWKVKDGMI
jgi:hypothetical protein